ncbi:MAG: tetratricopeptide repeat protein [Saprospiraceae bacterium]
MSHTQCGHYKLVFKGELHFGVRKAYDLAISEWNTRLDRYYKTDVLFKQEAIFDEENLILSLKVHTAHSASDKAWKHTVGILGSMAQFAIMGKIMAWKLENGALRESAMIEPTSDKGAAVMFRKGCILLDKGEIEEAAEALTTVITRYEHHALAFERRGIINYKLKNFDAALRDFSKSIVIKPDLAPSYYGCGKVHMIKNQWEEACAAFTQAHQYALALESVYWLARLRKGECLTHLERFEEAFGEVNAYLNRKFPDGDYCASRIPKAYFIKGKALLGLGQIDEGLDCFLAARKEARIRKNLNPRDQKVVDRFTDPVIAGSAREALNKGLPLEAVLRAQLGEN